MPRFRLALIFLFFSLSHSKSASAEVRDMPLLTIYASSSMTVPLSEAIRSYTTTHPVMVNTVYESSIELASRIEETGDADLFLSSHTAPIQRLITKKLIDPASVVDVFGNQIAIVVAKDSSLFPFPAHITDTRTILERLQRRTILVIADPNSSPLGIYSRDALERLGIWQQVFPRALHTANAAGTVYLIAKGKTAGICYYSDAIQNPEVHIVATLPLPPQAQVTYQGGLLASRNSKEATDFLHFLHSDEIQTLFTKQGFRAIPQ